jgi:hypothetical protein
MLTNRRWRSGDLEAARLPIDTLDRSNLLRARSGQLIAQSQGTWLTTRSALRRSSSAGCNRGRGTGLGGGGADHLSHPGKLTI